MARHLLRLLLLLILSLPAVAQNLPVSVEPLVLSNDPVLVLKHAESGRTLAIHLGTAEATAIALALDHVAVPRPLTHDLFKSTLEALHAKLDRVVIYALVGTTYHARLCLLDATGVSLEVDARPSDGVALALRTGAPIFVTEQVLSQPPPPPPVRARPARTPQEKAAELVRQGRVLEGQAFTTAGGAFDPRSDTSGAPFRAALQKYDEAIRLCPDYGPAYAARSSAHYFLHDVANSQKDARKALQVGHLKGQDMMLLGAAFRGEAARQIERQCMKLATPKDPLYGMLWHELAQTYWYEGNFRGYVRELEAMLPWQRKHPQMLDLILESLGRGYEVLGDYSRAEKALLESGDGDSLVRFYIHRERWSEARAALASHAFQPAELTLFAAGIDELEGKLTAVTPEQLKAAQELGGDGSYYAFFLGLLQLRDGQAQAGRATLEAFCQMCESNPSEWGVTMAWEFKRARQIVQPR